MQYLVLIPSALKVSTSLRNQNLGMDRYKSDGGGGGLRVLACTITFLCQLFVKDFLIGSGTGKSNEFPFGELGGNSQYMNSQFTAWELSDFPNSGFLWVFY